MKEDFLDYQEVFDIITNKDNAYNNDYHKYIRCNTWSEETCTGGWSFVPLMRCYNSIRFKHWSRWKDQSLLDMPDLKSLAKALSLCIYNDKGLIVGPKYDFSYESRRREFLTWFFGYSEKWSYGGLSDFRDRFLNCLCTEDYYYLGEMLDGGIMVFCGSSDYIHGRFSAFVAKDELIELRKDPEVLAWIDDYKHKVEENKVKEGELNKDDYGNIIKALKNYMSDVGIRATAFINSSIADPYIDKIKATMEKVERICDGE